MATKQPVLVVDVPTSQQLLADTLRELKTFKTGFEAQWIRLRKLQSEALDQWVLVRRFTRDVQRFIDRAKDSISRFTESSADEQTNVAAAINAMLEEYKSVRDGVVQWLQCQQPDDLKTKNILAADFKINAARLRQWFVAPLDAAFPRLSIPRVAGIYGPAANGKTLLIRYAKESISNDPRIASTLIEYDCRNARDVDNARLVSTLRDVLDCAQFTVSAKYDMDILEQLKSPFTFKDEKAVVKLALVVLDHFDTLFLTDSDLARTTTDDYISPGTAAAVTGSNLPIPSSLDVKAPRSAGTVPDGVVDIEKRASYLLSHIFSESDLTARWPNVRIILSMRAPWSIPPALYRSLVENRELFVDLPGPETRFLAFRNWIQYDRLQHLTQRVLQLSLGDVKHVSTTTATNLAPKARVQGEVSSLDAALKETDNELFIVIIGKLASLTLKPVVSETQITATDRETAQKELHRKMDRLRQPAIFALVTELSGYVPYQENLAKFDDLMRPTYTELAQKTGMSLAGYCKMELSGVSRSQVETFLAATRRQNDIQGRSLYGYNMSDMERFIRFLEDRVTTRQLHEWLQMQSAYMHGMPIETASTKCRVSARDVELGFNAGAPNYIAPSERGSCQGSYSSSLVRSADSIQDMPDDVRLGSHRILPEDVIRALNAFDSQVTPKPDYPQFVNYLLFRQPEVPIAVRSLRRPGDIPSLCNTLRPGPISTAMQARLAGSAASSSSLSERNHAAAAVQRAMHATRIHIQHRNQLDDRQQRSSIRTGGADTWWTRADPDDPDALVLPMMNLF